MTEAVTFLDAAYAAVSADPENDVLRLRFYERLADGEMFMLLEHEVEGDQITPRVFPLESGPVVLVFDREDRLAAFSGGISPYAALPGRVIAAMLKGQGMGLGVNLGVAPSSMLLPPEALDWLALALETGPEEAEERPESFHAPTGLPADLLTGLDAKLARAGGLAAGVLLAGVRYAGGRRGHILAFLDAPPGAQTALARAVGEALVFSGVEAGELDVVFLQGSDPSALAMSRVALRIDLPQPEMPQAPAAPGMRPDKPPILR
ncbi:SseB family protein [Tabrizicola sp.]|uniref:SseB family protein n=1 Tax=Tabrizicola sp. TaxID=2005166 RepID=UPI00286AA866|nr:SseB family protein [Tabrizicola sp.]